MQARDTVTRVLEPCKAFVHAARLRVLDEAVTAAFNGKALSLTTLALGLSRETTLRHRVKCIDRLLCNTHLDNERFEIYRTLAERWLTGLPQLLIVVDWSSLTADLQWHWLRASVTVEGRSRAIKIWLCAQIYADLLSRQQLQCTAPSKAKRMTAACFSRPT